ncbi:MAG TPA: hypothetical protein VLV76_13105 [Candidatus Acidoferrum sp.]|nr:hypothetical protein [Candidatus Acidoferrum sp.]
MRKMTVAAGAVAGIALLSVMDLGSTAMGAMNAEEQCKAWQEQFDTEIKTHATHAKAAEAKALAEKGSTECKEHKWTEGSTKLEEALKSIGVKPKG